MANPLVALQAQMPNIVGAYQAGQRGTEELQTARLGRVMEQMKLDAAQREQTQQNALQQFYQSQGQGLVQGDPNAISGLAKLNPGLAQGFQEKALAGQDAQRKRALDNAEFIGRGVDDVLSSKDDTERANKYNGLIMEAAKNGIDVSRAPPQWGSEAIAYLSRAKAMSMSVKDKAAAQEKAQADAESARRFGITSGQAAATAAEAARHNRATESNAATTGEFGRSMTGRAYNILGQGLKDPSIRSTPEYATAWQILSQPKVDPATGTAIIPDLSAFAPPERDGAAPGTAPPQRMPTVSSFQPPNPNATEALSAGFARRLNSSADIIDRTESAATSLGEQTKSGVPVIGNYLVSSDYQTFDQAQRDFINAQLRRESGAVISPEEFSNARKQYLPQPGDSSAVLAQKKRARRLAVANMAQAAGNVLNTNTAPIPGNPQGTSSFAAPGVPGGQPQGGSIPPAAIDHLRQNPSLSAAFDAKYGPGAAKAALGAQGRASGGPIRAGQPYMVGEQGPEMVVPQQNGTVIPNQQTGYMEEVPGSFRPFTDEQKRAFLNNPNAALPFAGGGAYASPAPDQTMPVAGKSLQQQLQDIIAAKGGRAGFEAWIKQMDAEREQRMSDPRIRALY